MKLYYRIPPQPPRQDSLTEQLRDVHMAATRLGCYDAADWLWKHWHACDTRVSVRAPQNGSQRLSATFKAWDLIGFDGQLPYEPERTEYGQGSVRIVGGRTRYEAVGNNGGSMVRLSKLKVGRGGLLRAIVRYVDPDTLMEFIPEAL